MEISMKNTFKARFIVTALSVLIAGCANQITVVTPIVIPPTAAIEASQTLTYTSILTSTPVMTATMLPTATLSSEKDGTLALAYLQDLSNIGSRVLASTGHQQAIDYLTNSLLDMGYAPETQSFKTRDGFDAVNIIATKTGNSDRVIIAGGHFDTVNIGSGVDDNGSGVAVLLEAAKRLKDMETPYTIRFVFFDAEETGLEGSFFYVSKMTPQEIENTAAMINLDSLAAGDYTYIYGNEGKAGVIRDWALEYARDEGFDLITSSGKNPNFPAGTTIDSSDHAPFLHGGIQYAYFEATNWDLGEMDGYKQVDLSLGKDGEIWHTEFDNIDYINQTFPGRMEEHLRLFSNVLIHILTMYQK
jgi:alkaline phosphatase isozyme conversion protein